jgi:hypothetical protein
VAALLQQSALLSHDDIFAAGLLVGVMDGKDVHAVGFEGRESQ